MREGVTITHIMADGTECKDLSKYLETHQLPPEVMRVLAQILFGKRREERMPEDA